MRKLRRLTEAEVIAEFLRGEFFQKEYDADRERFASLVENPNLTDARRTRFVASCCFAAATPCGGSCLKTGNGGKLSSSLRTWSR